MEFVDECKPVVVKSVMTEGHGDDRVSVGEHKRRSIQSCSGEVGFIDKMNANLVEEFLHVLGTVLVSALGSNGVEEILGKFLPVILGKGHILHLVKHSTLPCLKSIEVGDNASSLAKAGHKLLVRGKYAEEVGEEFFSHLLCCA